MSEYVLSQSVEDDLDKIAQYTIERWGISQARRYGSALEAHFGALASETAKAKLVFDYWPELQVSRCEHHYVFSLRRSASPLAILAVFHESMDLPMRLRERLDDESIETYTEDRIAEFGSDEQEIDARLPKNGS